MNRTERNSPRDPLPPGLRPQFRLFTLFLIITLLALVLAAFQYLGPMGTFVLILAILVIIAHVAGNAIGTALRDNVSPKHQPRDPASLLPSIEKPFAPSTKLGETHALGRPIYIITAISAPFWGILGITLAKILSAKPISLPSSIAGALVLATLGAFWTFVIGSFLQVGFGAFLHALRHSKPPPPDH